MNCCRSKTLVKLKRDVVSPRHYKLSNYSSSSHGIDEMRVCACMRVCVYACMSVCVYTIRTYIQKYKTQLFHVKWFKRRSNQLSLSMNFPWSNVAKKTRCQRN